MTGMGFDFLCCLRVLLGVLLAEIFRAEAYRLGLWFQVLDISSSTWLALNEEDDVAALLGASKALLLGGLRTVGTWKPTAGVAESKPKQTQRRAVCLVELLMVDEVIAHCGVV